MAGKLDTIGHTREMVVDGMAVHLFSMPEAGNLKAILADEPGVGTEIVG